jgi:hypothetical protein
MVNSAMRQWLRGCSSFELVVVLREQRDQRQPQQFAQRIVKVAQILRPVTNRCQNNKDQPISHNFQLEYIILI